MATINPPALSALREAHGFTKRKLAAKAGITHSFLVKIEAGSGNPSPTVIKGLALALGVPIAAITCPPVLAAAS